MGTMAMGPPRSGKTGKGKLGKEESERHSGRNVDW